MGKWLAILSLVLTAVLALVIWDSRRQEFPAYQKAYFGAVAANAPTQLLRQWAQSQRIEIKQQFLGELRRLDRCQTCHLAVDNPAFRDVAEPLRTHPGLLDSHPPERFGCVSCHGGEGLALTTLAGHEGAEGQTKRLLKGEYMQAACFQCHGEKTLPPEAVGAVVRGRQLVNQNRCLRCHQIGGKGGNEGPDLTVVGSRRDSVWIYAHFINPQAMNLVSTMPRFPLSRDDIKYLTTFLLTLRGGTDRITDTRYIASKSAEPGWRWPEKLPEPKAPPPGT
ncbi:MAG: c-type cytochrome, partial [Pseudomonadota bacterium]